MGLKGENVARKDQDPKPPLPEKDQKLAQFGEIMQDLAIFDPNQYHTILRGVEFRSGEKPIDYVERMQIFAGPPLMKMAILNVNKNPNLSAKIFMFYMEPVIKRQQIDLNVRQEHPVDVLSDKQVAEGLIDELLKNPETKKILVDKVGEGLLEDKGE
jgi:hypothetical protein